MEAAEVRSGQPEDDEAAEPVRRFVVIVGEPGVGSPAFRIEDPARLLRVWSLLQATQISVAVTGADADAADRSQV